MKFITRADGPYYLHFRPYHLCDLETPQSIAEAVLLGEVTVTAEAMHAEVVCTAKRDIRPASASRHRRHRLARHDHDLPRRPARSAPCPSASAPAPSRRRPITRGATITEDDVIVDESTFVCRLRRLQDALDDR